MCEGEKGSGCACECERKRERSLLSLSMGLSKEKSSEPHNRVLQLELGHEVGDDVHRQEVGEDDDTVGPGKGRRHQEIFGPDEGQSEDSQKRGRSGSIRK